MAEPARVSAVVLAYGTQPLLEATVEGVLASVGVVVDVVLVDNGGDPETVARVGQRNGVRVLSPGRNLGFAAGSNLGARNAVGEYVAFVNGDVMVPSNALATLVSALQRPGERPTGIATASVRLEDRPEVINSAGNPVHFLGLSWAGGLGRPASEFPDRRTVASASGATMVMRRDRFLEVGGFCETLFTYVEDTDLSLRVWQRGWSVEYVPDAIVLHDYEFARNPGKFYLLERNRLFVLLTVFPARLLWLVSPALVGLELAVLGLAARDGWARQKVAGWWWVARHLPAIRRRRRELATARVLDDRTFAALLTSRFDPGVEGMSVPRFAQRALDAYWRAATRLL
ncbi:MAG TPA: glycosyltransferase family 2 protein [Nocardioides sp.]|nr:glycosyltransferase family 2 protein [Nocardioides sp.]